MSSGCGSAPTSVKFWKYVPLSPAGFSPSSANCGGDVFGGEIAAARADAAAFEQIARQKFHVRAHALAGDVVDSAGVTWAGVIWTQRGRRE